MAVPSWLTAGNVLLFILLLGGFATLLVQQSIEISKGNKYNGNDFHARFTTSFVLGSIIILIAIASFLRNIENEDLFAYLIIFGAIGGIALSMIQILFSKLRLNYMTID